MQVWPQDWQTHWSTFGAPFGVAVDPRRSILFLCRSDVAGDAEDSLGSVTAFSLPDPYHDTAHSAEPRNPQLPLWEYGRLDCGAGVKLGCPMGCALDELTDELFVVDNGAKQMDYLIADAHCPRIMNTV